MNKWMMGLMLVFSAPALADTAARDGRPHFVERVSARVGLDAEAAARLDATFQKFRAQAQPVRQDAHQTARALREELRMGRADEAKVTQLTAQLAADRQKLRAIHTARLAEVQKDLTPVQYAKLLMLHHSRHNHQGRRQQG